ncbi:hypothetical protein UFOVP140_12 [uncultured Caudovirales phage]|jgi:hypothetical protein|uniref:Uncharacterized protein n=1 Tax=uncultured Caudovirales phage TaxID=2100421 RepID=A0A6J5LIQ8_9CAUD|nr:hypothetical protein UFOVP140_12 [uncultured Caudovirales phage]
MNIEKAKCFEDDERLVSLKRALSSALWYANIMDNRLDALTQRRKEAWEDVDGLYKKLREHQHGRA